MNPAATIGCLLVCLAVLFAGAGASSAATVRVDVSGGGDYLTIQEGLDAAAGCDTVLVAPGTYTGPQNRALSFGLKNLVLEAEQGFSTVTIDCQGQDRAFLLNNAGQDTISAIRGFEIRNACTDNYNGGAMKLFNVSVIVEDCLFEDCMASHNGGAIYIGYNPGPGPRIRNCVFRGNSATYRAGALMVDFASATIRTCLFVDNSTSAGGEEFYGGGAVHLNWIDDRINTCGIYRSTFVGNSSGGRGAAIFGWNSVITTFIEACIIAFNEGPAMGVDSSPMFETLTMSVVYGNEGGNFAPGYSTLIEEHPRFCSLAWGDYTLCANSPALPENNIYDRLMGFADQGCGPCDTAVRESSWGRVKALYR